MKGSSAADVVRDRKSGLQLDKLGMFTPLFQMKKPKLGDIK